MFKFIKEQFKTQEWESKDKYIEALNQRIEYIDNAIEEIKNPSELTEAYEKHLTRERYYLNKQLNNVLNKLDTNE